jgi:hypothetical protein
VIVALRTPYADTTAADLGFAWGLPPQPALHVLEVGPLQLRLLGTSHQALLGPVSETVACLPTDGAELPSRPVTMDLPGGWRYSFSVRVDRYDPASFAAEVTAVRLSADRDGAVLGEFPGAPGAVTALSARPTARGLRWCTVHAYPQSGEIVRTWTRVRSP